MFEANKLNNDRVEKALALFRQYDRGEVVPHGEMAAAIGVDEKYSLYYRIVRRARVRLMDEDGVCVTPITAVGWAMLTEQQTLVEEPVRRHKKARRQINHSYRAVTALSAETLSPNQVRLRDAAIEHDEVLRRSLSARREATARILAVHQGNPLRTG